MKKRKAPTVIFGLIASQLITWGVYGFLAQTFLPTHYLIDEPMCIGGFSTSNCNIIVSVPLPPPLFAAVLFVVIAAEALGFVGMWMLVIVFMNPCQSNEDDTDDAS